MKSSSSTQNIFIMQYMSQKTYLKITMIKAYEY